MNGIYLTEEGKKEIEAKIAELQKENELPTHAAIPSLYKYYQGRIDMLQEILSSATILPVEESWNDVLGNTERDDCVYSCKSNCPNGVIIEPKE